MGLFGKKNCDVCGSKIGILGNRKLDDGNLCKDCAKKLSPYFTGRRRSTVQDIKEQLDYREENLQVLNSFMPTRTIGLYTKVLLDEDKKQFIVTSSKNYKETNPDVIDFNMVTGAHLNIEHEQREIMQRDAQGKEISHNPQRFKYRYEFWITIHVNHPFFDEIRFKLNRSTIEYEPQRTKFFRGTAQDMGQNSTEYVQHEAIANEIIEALTDVRADVAQEKAPKQAQTCPYCGASTTPDAHGRCEFCGGSIG